MAMGFHAYDAYRAQGYGNPLNGAVKSKGLVAPENQKCVDWRNENAFSGDMFLDKQNLAIDLLNKAYQADRSVDIGASIERIVEKFKRVDHKKKVGELLKKFPDMDEYERRHLEAAAKIGSSGCRSWMRPSHRAASDGAVQV